MGLASYTRSTAHVEKFLELLPGPGPQRGQVSGEFVGMENFPHGSLETRKLSGKIEILLGSFGEVQQLLADQVIECVLQAEAPPDGAGGLALLSPNLVAVHEGNYSAVVRGSPS